MEATIVTQVSDSAKDSTLPSKQSQSYYGMLSSGKSGSYSETFRGRDDESLIKKKISEIMDQKVKRMTYFEEAEIIGLMIPYSPLEKYIEKVKTMYVQLRYNNSEVLTIAKDILKEFVNAGKRNLIISKTGDKEILFYTHSKDYYKNLMLDEDGDVSIIVVDRKNPERSYNKLFVLENDLDYKAIVELL